MHVVNIDEPNEKIKIKFTKIKRSENDLTDFD
jgi:hypothetical protein